MLTSVALIASSPLGSSVRTQDGRGAAWGLHELLAPEGSSGSPLTAAAVGLPWPARSLEHQAQLWALLWAPPDVCLVPSPCARAALLPHT